MNHTSISEIRELLEQRGIALKKRFGQNFLIDQNARRRIVDTILAERTAPGEVWEIGPGLGSLTDLLREADLPLRLFEVDHGIIAVLKDRFGDEVPLEKGDFLKTCLPAAQRNGLPGMIVGNLPYASASAMVTTVIDRGVSPASMVFLVQKELAERFRAVPGSKAYSALSVLVQNHYSTSTVFALGGGAFFPRPEVGSTVIVMRRLPECPEPSTSEATSLLARTAFSQRRKTLRKSLTDYLSILEACGVDSSLRPERITPEQFLKMGREYHRRHGAPG